MEQSPSPSPMTFEDLSVPQRIEAVLADAGVSMTRSMVLEYTGVNYDQLEEPDKQAVDAAFGRPGIQSTTDERDGAQYYAIPPEQREATFQRLGIDPTKVTEHVMSVIYNEWGGTEPPQILKA